jgi:hypothetical protein
MLPEQAVPTIRRRPRSGGVLKTFKKFGNKAFGYVIPVAR